MVVGSLLIQVRKLKNDSLLPSLGVYTDVALFREWLDHNMNKD